MFILSWDLIEKCAKVWALAKGLAVCCSRREIECGNFAHKVRFQGKGSFKFGTRNKFLGVTFDARKKNGNWIHVGSKNIFEQGVAVTCNSGNVKIGDQNIISTNAIISGHKGCVNIGNNVFIGPNSIIQGMGGVEIGDGSMIAANCFISSSNHNFENPLAQDYLKHETGEKVTIGKKVWVGASVVITAGVSIGDNSVIGAGSVVTKDIESFSVAVGNPAKIIRKFNKEMLKWEKL